MIARALLVVAAAVLAGCSRQNNLLLGEVQAQVGRHQIRVTDCYRWSVPPPERLSGGDWRFMPCRDADVVIRGGELTVNGQSYGKISDSAGVLVDHGRVSVQ